MPSLFRGISDHARRRPGATAIVTADGARTYAELVRELHRVAGGLADLGVRLGDRVALMGHKTTTAVVSLLAVMRAGAAYVPLDPLAPDGRVAELVADARCQVILSSASHDHRRVAKLAEETGARYVDARSIHPTAGRALPNEIGGEAVAYCMYTSGSTGRAKGVQIPHRALDAFFAGFYDLVEIGPDARCLNTSALHFDVSAVDLLMPLRCGATVHLGPPMPVPQVLAGIISGRRITHMAGVGSTLTLIADGTSDFAGHDVSSLRRVVTGAEVLNPRTVQRWLAAAPELVVINGYGPTECTCSVINHPIREREPDRTELYPIGTPAPGTRIRFRAEDGRLDDDGPGEILIAGRQVMVGYLNRPEEDERSRATDGTTTYYRTGDWGSRRLDGVILYHGRRDDEVKIRGYRVNLNEVARTAQLHPAVRRAFVAAVPAGDGDLRLACATVPAADGDVRLAGAAAASGPSDASGGCGPAEPEPLDEAGTRELRAYLADRLPAYMLPAYFFRLAAVPVLPSQKPDVARIRQSLHAAVAALAGGRHPRRSPPTPSPPDIAAAGQATLGDDPASWLTRACHDLVGHHDGVLERSALELGMNSIAAIELAQRASTRFGVDLSPGAVLGAAALGDLLAALRTTPAPALAALRTAPALPASRPDFIPLTQTQATFYLANRLAPDSSAFNCPLVWRVRGTLNGGVLARALDDLSIRHPLLRGSLTTEAGDLGLRIAGAPYPCLSVLTAPDEAAARRLAREVATAPLLNEDGHTLWRAALITVAAEPICFFVLVRYHALVDWASGQLLMRDLSHYYARRETGEYPIVTATPVAAILAERRARNAAPFVENTRYWRNELRDLPVVRTPPGASSVHQTLRIPGPTVARLRAVARGAHTTMHNVLLTGLATAVRQWSGRDDVAIGVSCALPRPGIAAEVCAPLMNTLCVRVDRADLATISTKMITALRHGELPIARTAGVVVPPRYGTPLFEVSFSFQELPAPALAVGLPAEPVDVPVDAMFPVELSAVPDGDEIRVDLASRLPAGGPDGNDLLTLFGRSSAALASCYATAGAG